MPRPTNELLVTGRPDSVVEFSHQLDLLAVKSFLRYGVGIYSSPYPWTALSYSTAYFHKVSRATRYETHHENLGQTVPVDSAGHGKPNAHQPTRRRKRL